ncbi:MAG: hypothetical protein HQ558_05810 [Candidatus Omnitrophica bacterium]|nr:hypothetical protein [Candidatus Omnitrophota bacterium]
MHPLKHYGMGMGLLPEEHHVAASVPFEQYPISTAVVPFQQPPEPLFGYVPFPQPDDGV